MVTLALIGYGQMGQKIHQLAGDSVVATIDPVQPTATHRTLTAEAVADADVCIDFSHPSAVMDNIRFLVDHSKDFVVGTTGWETHEAEVRDWVVEAGIACVYAENFSLGVQTFLTLVEEAALRYSQLDGYDIAGVEVHHAKKADSPSGTGRVMAERVVNAWPEKNHVLTEALDGRVDPQAFHLASLRCGAVPGTHSVVISSEADTITLTHQAHHREAWAKGAIVAAEWAHGRQGFYHVTSVLKEKRLCAASTPH